MRLAHPAGSMAVTCAGAAPWQEATAVLQPITPLAGTLAGATPVQPAGGDTLVNRLEQQIEVARALERDAHAAVDALSRGERTDVEGVLLASRKADAAFQMLQVVHRAMLQAYAEMRDMRV